MDMAASKRSVRVRMPVRVIVFVTIVVVTIVVVTIVIVVVVVVMMRRANPPVLARLGIRHE